MQVITPNGKPFIATAYVATKKEPTLRPYDWYKALVIAGAKEHKLPIDYVEWLGTFDSQPDSNLSRRAANKSLLIVK